jgi:hypothetical protein
MVLNSLQICPTHDRVARTTVDKDGFKKKCETLLINLFYINKNLHCIGALHMFYIKETLDRLVAHQSWWGKEEFS